MFQKGDQVKVIDDNQMGKVVKVLGNQITILNEFGFEEIFLAHELILDKPLEIGEVRVEEEVNKPKIKQENPLLEPKEIDLHIGQLVDSYAGLSNYEMLQIQLQKVRDELDLAKLERRSRLIFIHGHGSGKLKEELMNLLMCYKGIEVYDASFRKYKLGATEVKIRG